MDDNPTDKEEEKSGLPGQILKIRRENLLARVALEGLGDTSEKKEVKEELPFSEKIKRAKEEALLAKVYAGEVGEEKVERPQSGLQIKANLDLAEMMEAKEVMRQKADDAKDVWQGKFWDSQSQRMGDQMARLEKLMEQRFQQQQGQPSPFEIYRQVKGEVDEIKKDLSGGMPTQGVSSEVLIKLKEMEMNMNLQLRKMDQEMEDRRNQFMLEMKKWEDERRIRWAEFQDRSGTKEKALGELSKIARSMAEGIGEEEGKPSGPGVTASKMSFECPTCKRKLEAPRGQPKVTCDQCGDEHELNWEKG